jgi:hypothetical protein
MTEDTRDLQMTEDTRDLRTIAAELEESGMRCNCDLNKWEPESITGHSWVCRIHRSAMARKYPS